MQKRQKVNSADKHKEKQKSMSREFLVQIKGHFI